MPHYLSQTTPENQQIELSLYGSSRLGIRNKRNQVDPINDAQENRTRGKTYYQLANQLGNVLTTITDQKIGQVDGTNAFAHYEASTVSITDYYPFGFEIPGRTFSSNEYRYGFNGKEKDQNGELGELTHYDYGFRIYNPGIGKFLSVDPLTKSYPWYTPYHFAGNMPIFAVDLDGQEPLPYIDLAIWWNNTDSHQKLEDSKSVLTGILRGADNIIEAISPITRMTEEESQAHDAAVEEAGGIFAYLKQTPQRIKSIPSEFNTAMEIGDIDTKAELATTTIAFPILFLKGKTKVSSSSAKMAGFKLPKLSTAFKDWFTKCVHAHSDGKEIYFGLNAAGEITIKAMGSNMSKKVIKKLEKLGEKAIKSSDFRSKVIKKIYDVLGLKESKTFVDGAEKLKKFKKVLEDLNKAN